MKSPTVLLLLAVNSAFAQGNFQNLDFELATITPVTNSPDFPRFVYAADAIPGWTAYLGGSSQGGIYYDTVSLGAAEVSIHDSSSIEPVLEGNYTILLQPSFPGASMTAAVGQTGQIPLGTKSVRFYGTAYYALSFAGQPIPLATLGTGANYTMFGADVSAFAGQTGELRFTGLGLLDNIFFSPTAIPEPNVLTLSALGSLLLTWRFLRQTRPA